MEKLLPIPEKASDLQIKNVERMRADLQNRYFEAPDLKYLPKTGWRFINAVSDHATHVEPLRKTKQYKENLFDKTIDGHSMIDHAMRLLAA